MPDFPYPRSRDWINRSEGWVEGDPVADDVWFEALESAIHQTQDHEKASGYVHGGSLIVPCLSTERPANPPTNLHIFETDTGLRYYNAGTPEAPDWQPWGGGGGGSTETSVARAFSAYNSANYVLSSDEERLAFNSKAFDTHSEFDVATGRFTATVSGIYRFGSAARLSGVPSAAWVEFVLYKNGAPFLGLDLPAEDHATSTWVGGSRLANVAAADFFEVYLYIYSQSNTTVVGAADSTFFEGSYVGPLPV